MPLASISKVTSICGTPRGDGGMPMRSNEPSSLLSAAISRSPWNTRMVTAVWPSSAVENTWLFLVGIVVLRSISRVNTPPSVSMQWGTVGWGRGPHGEAFDHVQDIWKAGAPQVDMYCPDAYMGRQGVANHIVDLTSRYTRSGRTFFTIEATDGEIGAAHAFYAIGGQRAIGYSGMGNDGLLQWFTQTGINLPAVVSPPGMDSPARLVGFGGPGSTAPLPPIPPEYEAKALSQAFLTLSQIAPQILEHQSSGTIAAAVLDKEITEEHVKLGNYILNVGFPRRGGRAQTPVPDTIGYGLFMAVGPDEYLLAGNNLLITFTPNTPGPPIAGLAEHEAGRFDNTGKWVATHFLLGDDSMITNEPTADQSGSGARVSFGERSIQRVKLYRYR